MVDTQPTPELPPYAVAEPLAIELALPLRGVQAVLELLGDGATVPFIARYRKEATGALDEVQIRAIEERHAYLNELDALRRTVLETIHGQGKLDAALKARILACTTKAALEDLYLPYKPKRRTRAMIARERGLEPLADVIAAQPRVGSPGEAARAFVSAERGVPDVEAALAGARDIVAERIAEQPDIRAFVRETFAKQGTFRSKVCSDKKKERTKFEDYYDHAEPVATIPSHRFLAIRRGEEEAVLRAKIEVDADPLVDRIARAAKLVPRSPFAEQLGLACEDAYKRLLSPAVEHDVRASTKLRADREAVDVFADNLRSLLLAAPLGAKAVVGIDPGLRTGCKVVAVDATGKYLEAIVVYPSQGEASAERGKRDLAAFVSRHRPAAIAVGNGTGGREAEAFAREALKEAHVDDCVVVQVSEAGASVYSASEVAREEFPELDLTLRGAISIARRLQDPLAELVKIEPNAIGVGQYQHDVHQPLLAKKLAEVVESSVNAVGVELNTASAPLLSHVSGIGEVLAKKIVAHRERRGAFASRSALREVSGLGPKAFVLAAGFLRLRDGAHPLDKSAVHPERYELVERIARDMGVSLGELVGNAALADTIDVKRYVGEGVGEPTLRDIVSELKKPGRDPRASFEPPKFRADVTTMSDLEVGMVLEGVVTNVTAFGAFVDVGVHQDGLVHVSQLADRFVKDPREIVHVGDKLKVRVLEIDLVRGRISLTAKQGAPAPSPAPRPAADRTPPRPAGEAVRPTLASKFSNNPFGALKPK